MFICMRMSIYANIYMYVFVFFMHVRKLSNVIIGAYDTY